MTMKNITTHHDNDAAARALPEPRRNLPPALLTVGGILGALAVSSCCVLPLVLVSVGITGSWMGNLTALDAYRPYFIVATVVLLGGGFYMVYRRPKAVACNPDGTCGTSRSRQVTKVMLWIGAVLAVVGFGFPYAAPLLF